MRSATLFLVSVVVGMVYSTTPCDAAQVTLSNSASNSVGFLGSTVGQPTFHRPETGFPPPGLSPTATAVPYVSQAFDIFNTGSYLFSVQPITIPEGISGTYVFLYQDNFDPSQPLNGLIIGATPSATQGVLPTFTLPILFGNVRRYSLIVTGRTSTNVGIFAASISRQNSFIALGPSSQITPGAPFAFSPWLGLALCSGGWWMGRLWHSRSREPR